MKVLVACEFSGEVRRAFAAKGHDAYSCDLRPAAYDGELDLWHFQMDWRKAFALIKWDLVLGFPPCTDLCVSGARHFQAKRADGRQANAINFFLEFTKLPCKWAIENPIGIMSTHYRKPDQIIQPWQFGHGETKATCLWLNGLPPLRPTKIVDGRESRIHRMSPSKDRAEKRSITYSGIARAMAEQWG
jgi:hypothetical protein